MDDRSSRKGNETGNRGKGPKPHDVNITAFNLVQQVTGQVEMPEKPTAPEKNPAAVTLGRLGGLKGGIARKNKLSKEQLTNSARKAARARWSRD